MIDLVTDGASFAALEQEWSALLVESPGDTLFLSWEWLFTWWRHLGSHLRPALLTVRDEGRLQAVAPFVRHGWQPRRLRFHKTVGFLGAPLHAGNVGSDYLDVVVRRDSTHALAELVAEIAARGEVLDLAQVRGEGSAAGTLAASLGLAGWEVRSSPAGVCPVVDLRGHTWESYLLTRGREHRYAVQRKLRALKRRFQVSFEPARTEGERADALRVLIDLHERRWSEKGSSDAFHTPALRAFHEDFTRLALGRGWLRLFVLRLDGIAAAALYALRYGETFFFYQAGFDPAFGRWGVGTAALALSIESAIGEGAKAYDLLHGEEEYKFHWANGTRPLLRYSLFPPRAHGYVARTFAAARAIVRPVARRVLQNP